MAQASIGLSRSFESALADHGRQPVAAWEIVRSLLRDHEEYADYLGGKVAALPEPEGGERREALEWVAALRELYDPSLVGLIDGRLAIWGLSQLDPPLGDYLERHDFLDPLKREIRRETGEEPHALIRRRFVEEDEGATLKSDAPNILDRRQQVVPDDTREPEDLASQLAEGEQRQREGEQADEATTEAERGAEVKAPYRPPGPGYISDAVSDDAELVDHLGIEREVRTIAHIMTSKKVYPPLSLGLSGDWGSGKSFFMGKLRQHVAAIADYYREWEREGQEEQAGEWCTRVVQIDFNAWHYAGANLWVSLVTRIYEALYGELKGDEPTDEKTRRLIREKVQQAEEEVEAAAPARSRPHLSSTWRRSFRFPLPCDRSIKTASRRWQARCCRPGRWRSGRPCERTEQRRATVRRTVRTRLWQMKKGGKLPWVRTDGSRTKRRRTRELAKGGRSGKMANSRSMERA